MGHRKDALVRKGFLFNGSIKRAIPIKISLPYWRGHGISFIWTPSAFYWNGAIWRSVRSETMRHSNTKYCFCVICGRYKRGTFKTLSKEQQYMKKYCASDKLKDDQVCRECDEEICTRHKEVCGAHTLISPSCTMRSNQLYIKLILLDL